MLWVVLKLLGLLVFLAPVTAAVCVVWRRARPQAPASETLLAGLICVPILLTVEVVILGIMPFDHPLHYLLPVQGLLSALSAGAVWRCRRDLGELLSDARGDIAGAWRAANWVERTGLSCGLLTHLAATAFGAWNSPCGWDELSYHVPQAVQPYQDGRLGAVQTDCLWADSYPRGAELLYYWTLQLTRTDAGFHPVNAAFGVVFILATYVAARRAGLSAGAALLAAGLVPTAPVFTLLANIGYIDLPVAGAVVTMLAFALPQRDGAWSCGSCFACLAAMLLALWMKFSPVALVALTLMYRLALAFIGRIRNRSGPPAIPMGPRPLPLLLVTLAVLGLASVPYLRTWHKYGSPTYPLRLQWGPLVVFDGPMEPRALTPEADAARLKRYARYWLDYRAPLTVDSPGGFGPLFTLGMIGPALIVGLSQLLRPQRAGLLLTAAFWLPLALPAFHLPRYALHVLMPGALSALWLAGVLRVAWLRRTWIVALAFLEVCNLSIFLTVVRSALHYHASLGLPLLSAHRNRAIVEQNARQAMGLAPETRAAVYRLIRPGETLVAAVHDFYGLLYDADYSYRVEHRPAKPWPYGHEHARNLAFGRETAQDWLAGLHREGVAGIVVYRDSAEDLVLRLPDSGYRLVYTQPAGTAPGGERIYSVLIYRRDTEIGPLQR